MMDAVVRGTITVSFDWCGFMPCLCQTNAKKRD